MAEYTTIVLSHVDEGEARAISQALHKRYPMIRTKRSRRKTHMSGVSMGDLMSLNEMAISILESRLLPRDERAELALSILTCNTQAECDKVMAEWDVKIEMGELVEVKEEDDVEG